MQISNGMFGFVKKVRTGGKHNHYCKVQYKAFWSRAFCSDGSHFCQPLYDSLFVLVPF
jgi:hypothetical protein